MGYCKFCRTHDVNVTRFDRYPDNALIRNERGESQGICWECELQDKSTKAELLEAMKYIGRDSMHMYIATREILSLLNDIDRYNVEDIFNEISTEQKNTSLKKEGVSIFTDEIIPNAAITISKIGRDVWVERVYKNLEQHVGAIVVAASRMKLGSTLMERKQGARSLFLKADLKYDRKDQEELRKEYGVWFCRVV
jgi:hypothetical protein